MSAPISSLIRAAVFVSDLARSTAFYQAIGLTEVYYEGTLDAASAQAALHTPVDSHCICKILKRPKTPNFGMVGLFAVSGQDEPERPSIITPRPGEVALVFYVADMQATLAAGQSLASVIVPPITFVMPHRSQAEVCLRDPDGVLINLIERDVNEQFLDQPAKMQIAPSG
jgi:catechol 2,3-dioxygenase-like lactoylglutathione lyase family enzyme